MQYNVKLFQKFNREFGNLPSLDQEKILDFIEIFENYGFSDFKKYKGKITPSWIDGDINYLYARSNELWHYHIGIPHYVSRPERPYLTSDFLLHFSWPSRGNTIWLADLNSHYDSQGRFNLPHSSYLER